MEGYTEFVQTAAILLNNVEKTRQAKQNQFG
jgi:hypothetical protein